MRRGALPVVRRGRGTVVHSDIPHKRGAAGVDASSESGALLFGYTDDPALIDGARRLVAKRYLSEGYIEPVDITSTGVMNDRVDPYHSTSSYFVAVDDQNQVVATIRQVSHDPNGALTRSRSVPTCACSRRPGFSLRSFQETPGSSCQAWPRNPWIESQVSSRLYREMWARSFSQGHEFWLIATHPRFARWLKGISSPLWWSPAIRWITSGRRRSPCS